MVKLIDEKTERERDLSHYVGHKGRLLLMCLIVYCFRGGVISVPRIYINIGNKAGSFKGIRH